MSQADRQSKITTFSDNEFASILRYNSLQTLETIWTLKDLVQDWLNCLAAMAVPGKRSKRKTKENKIGGITND